MEGAAPSERLTARSFSKRLRKPDHPRHLHKICLWRELHSHFSDLKPGFCNKPRIAKSAQSPKTFGTGPRFPPKLTTILVLEFWRRGDPEYFRFRHRRNKFCVANAKFGLSRMPLLVGLHRRSPPGEIRTHTRSVLSGLPLHWATGGIIPSFYQKQANADQILFTSKPRIPLRWSL